MTVQPSSPVSGPYLTDGVSSLWEFNFKVNSADHMRLYVTDLDGSNAVEVSNGFTIGAEYLGQDTGGYVQYPASGVALPAGKRIIPFRAVPYSQTVKIGNQGGFFPETHEKAFDLLCMQIQQLNERSGNALTMPIGYTGDTTLTSKDGWLLGWDGFNLINYNPAELIDVVVTPEFTLSLLEVALATAPRIPTAGKIWINGGLLMFGIEE